MRRSYLYCLLVVALVCFCIPLQADDQSISRCDTFAATLEVAEGAVVYQIDPSSDWMVAELGSGFCYGDRLKVLEFRAAIRLENDTLVRLKEGSIIHFIEPDESFWVELIKGAAHFISRTPKSFKVKAPYVNAAVEGTEFLADVNEQFNQVSVFEGKVALKSSQGMLSLIENQTGRVDSQSEISLLAKIKIKELADWTLYYPPIFSVKNLDERVADLVNREKYRDALEILTVSHDLDDLIFASTLLLNLGDIEGANEILLKINSQTGEAENIRTVKWFMGVLRGEVLVSLRELESQINAGSQSLNTKIVYSYALQGTGQLVEALEVMETLYENDRVSISIKARYAELLWINGEFVKANAMIQEALSQSPNHSQLNNLAGFISLNNFESNRALDYFNRGLNSNSDSALAYFGLGLTYIQESDLVNGRKYLELAVLLDPSNSLFRSYLGKVYFEIYQEEWAGTQYLLAKELDSNDPTPWYYHAYLLQSENKFKSAISSMRKAIVLNNNRSSYRKQSILNDDQNSRNKAITELFTKTGFTSTSKIIANKNVTDNFDDHFGHYELAIAMERNIFQIKNRVDESLLFKILHPVGVNPFPVGFSNTESQLGVWVSPLSAGVNEYGNYFTKKAAKGYVNFFSGSQSTKGHDGQLTLTGKNNSLSVGQYKVNTDGFRENNFINEELSEILIKNQGDGYKLFLESSFSEWETGDLSSSSLDTAIDNTLARRSKNRGLSSGLSLELSDDSNVLMHVAQQENKSSQSYSVLQFGVVPFSYPSESNLEDKVAQFEFNSIFNIFSYSIGVDYLDKNLDEVSRVKNELADLATEEQSFWQDIKRRDYYFDVSILHFNSMDFHTSLSYVDYNSKTKVSESTFFEPLPSELEYEYTDESFNYSNTIGFNFGGNTRLALNNQKNNLSIPSLLGTIHSRTIGGVNLVNLPVYLTSMRSTQQVLTHSWVSGSASIELAQVDGAELRDNSTTGERIEAPLDIDLATLNLDWAVSDSVTGSLAYTMKKERVKSPNAQLSPTPSKLDTDKVSLTLGYSISSNWRLVFNVEQYDQDRVIESLLAVGDASTSERSTFYNLEANYQLPKRVGVIKFIGANLGDEKSDIYDRGVLSAADSLFLQSDKISPEKSVLMRIELNF